MCLFLYWLPKCLHWPFCPGVFIAILAVVAAAVTFRERPSQREKAAWICVFLGLMCAEVWMMGIDRQANEDREAKANATQLQGFTNVGEGIKASIAESQRNFTATMNQFSAQSTALAKLDREQLILGRQISDVPLSSMSTQELVDKARAVAQQMRAYEHTYQYQDQELNLQLSDPLEGPLGWKMSAKELQQYMSNARQKRVDLQREYEVAARRTIAQANRLVVEMIARLDPGGRSPKDAAWVNWFGNPTPGETDSFLFELDEHATYLEKLAQRITPDTN